MFDDEIHDKTAENQHRFTRAAIRAVSVEEAFRSRAVSNDLAPLSESDPTPSTSTWGQIPATLDLEVL